MNNLEEKDQEDDKAQLKIDVQKLIDDKTIICPNIDGEEMCTSILFSVKPDVGEYGYCFEAEKWFQINRHSHECKYCDKEYVCDEYGLHKEVCERFGFIMCDHCIREEKWRAPNAPEEPKVVYF